MLSNKKNFCRIGNSMKTKQREGKQKIFVKHAKISSRFNSRVLASPSNKFASCDAAEIFVKPTLRSYWIFTAEPGIEKGVG